MMKANLSIIWKIVFVFITIFPIFWRIPVIIQDSLEINLSAIKILNKALIDPKNLVNMHDKILGKSDLYECRIGSILGEAQNYGGDFQNAIMTLEGVVWKCPTNRLTLLTLANLENRIGDKEKAKLYFSEAKASDLLNEQCQRSIKSNDYERASEFCALAVSINDADISSWENLGNALVAMGNRAGAKEAFKQVLHRSNNSLIALVGLGNLYLSEQNFELALENFKRAIDLSPENPSVWLGMGEVYFESQNYIKAVEYTQKAVELDPSRPAPHAYLGRSLFFLNSFDVAAKELNIAVKLLPGKLAYRKWLGDVYFEIGNKSQALEQYEIVLRTNSNDGKLLGKVNQLKKDLGLGR